MLIIIILIFLFIASVFCFYMIDRDARVSNFRSNLIDKVDKVSREMIMNGNDNWKRSFDWFKSVTYNEMVRRFWIWPLEKFYPQSLEDYLKFPSQNFTVTLTTSEPWKPEVDDIFFSPTDKMYGKVEKASNTFSEYTLEKFKKGEYPFAFKNKEHALEAGKRILETLEKYHKEIGY
jgi:hypothetical protein